VKYLVFLLRISAFVVLYLSIHQEIVAERTRHAHDTGHASHMRNLGSTVIPEA
jgi:hypothetical protein